MNESELMLRTRKIKRVASQILFRSEIPRIGQFRPAARRAWNKANAVQLRLIAEARWTS